MAHPHLLIHEQLIGLDDVGMVQILEHNKLGFDSIDEVLVPFPKDLNCNLATG
jgi:hypothetical protein